MMPAHRLGANQQYAPLYVHGGVAQNPAALNVTTTGKNGPGTTPKRRDQRGRDPKRRERKYEREKRRRDVVSHQFAEICSLLGIEVGAADRTYVLGELLEAIKKKNAMQKSALQGRTVPGAIKQEEDPTADFDNTGDVEDNPIEPLKLQRRRASSIGAIAASSYGLSGLAPLPVKTENVGNNMMMMGNDDTLALLEEQLSLTEMGDSNLFDLE
mmetsp:Transcript_2935/g.4989  ORF Transcript_2935/g.4989 Transcript_2935/m.4989 type:complete len:213 (+) Transcript_2935:138-776(+)